MGYTGGIMALYSWFVENKKQTNNKNIRTKSSFKNSSVSNRYIANYTMWPTAKIKEGILIKLPIHNKIKGDSTIESSEQELAIKIPLIVNE